MNKNSEFTFTRHALDNMRTRFNGLVTMAEVLNAVRVSNGRQHYTVKTLPRAIIIRESADESACPRGDMIMAVVDGCEVVNVILRFKNQRSDFYRDRAQKQVRQHKQSRTPRW